MTIFIGFVKQNIIYLITILKINIKISYNLYNLENILSFLIIFFPFLIAISYFHFFLFLFYFSLLINSYKILL